MSAVSWQVFAPVAVQGLLCRESDVMAYVRKFAGDEAPAPFVDVAGPPTAEELARARRKGQQGIPLPCIRLNLKKQPHHLTGVPTIYVTASDDDLIEIARWNALAFAPAPTGPRLYD